MTDLSTLYNQLLDFEETLTPQRIKQIRLSYGFTQKKFAKLLGVNNRTYESWEGGFRYPSSPGHALLLIAESNTKVFIENSERIIRSVYEQNRWIK